MPDSRPHGDRQGGEPAVATSRRDQIVEAGELVRNMTDCEEQRLFIETALADVDRIDWLKTALGNISARQPEPERDEFAGEQFLRERLRDTLFFCPVSGRRLDPGRVFYHWSQAARAKFVINGLLSDHPADNAYAESVLATWHNPAAAYVVVGICRERGITRIKTFRNRIADLFLEVQRIAEVIQDTSADDGPKSERLHRQIEHARQLLGERSQSLP